MTHVVRAPGPLVLLIHGSAADHTTWSIQLASPLRERLALVAYDRDATATTVEAHADDAVARIDGRAIVGGSSFGAAHAARIDGRAIVGSSFGAAQSDDAIARIDGRAIVVGSSFGAVIALDALRRYPDRVAGAVLIEPPMGADDATPAAPQAFLAAYDRCAAEQGGPAAAELFLRTVLGDAAYARMPKAYQDRSKSKHAEIRADSAALLAYRPRYAELASVTAPVLLLGGERSAAYFRPTLEALRAHLPNARLEIVPAAGHMLHAEAHRRFGELLLGFAAEVAVD